VDVLGVDIGGVVIQRTGDAEEDDTSFWGPNYLETPEVDDAIATIAALSRDRFGDAVYLVSKCGVDTEERSREWLSHNGFFERTGIPPTHVYFCRKREEKAPICATLGITHFVDDRLEVLSYLVDVRHRYLFQARDEEVAEFSSYLKLVERVDSWKAIRAALER
jgi:NADH:ubiquinone oxidoreductase subunit